MRTAEDFAERLKKFLPDRYRILRQIGQGGFSLVFLAYDSQTKRDVAIKALRPEFALAGQMSRFLLEIEIVARLSHPNILPLYDTGDAGGILYYVMPFLERGSLKQHLRKQGPLSVKYVREVTAQIASALDHAHRARSTLGEGFVHRDIKPENVLLDADDRAYVADFGIAQVVSQADADTLTSYGMRMGTWEYMSPEQCAGTKKVDSRTDIYSLGCVVYELLSGEVPFTGPTGQAIAAKHMSQPPASLRHVLPDLPKHIDAAVLKALSKMPGERFQTAGEFATALATPLAEEDLGPSQKWKRIAAMAASAVLAVVFVAIGKGDLGGSGKNDVGDTTRVALVPFEYGPGVDTPLNEVQRFHDGLKRWSGLTIVDQFRINEQIKPGRTSPMTAGDAAEIARRAGAARFVWGDVTRLGDSLHTRAGIYDVAGGGTLLADRTVRMPLTLQNVDSLLVEAGDRLLFRGLLADTTEARIGSRSLPARQAFLLGQRALEEWNLPRADSAFTRADSLDLGYTQAQLWSAVAREWSGFEPAKFRLAAEQAFLSRSQLSAREREIANAVVAHARGDMRKACDTWRGLAKAYPRDFTSWYGSAFCQKSDSIVIKDESSPSGWRFRTSYSSALAAYKRAFELNPSFQGAAFSPPVPYR